MTTRDVVIVGGGVWGLSLAWHLASQPGTTVTIVERRASPGFETSARAAGQIGQLREAPIANDAAAYALEFATAIAARRDPEALVQSGSVTLLESAAAPAVFATRIASARARGVAVDLIDDREARRLVPGLVGEFTARYWVEADAYVEPARYVRALAAEVRARGVNIVCDAAVTNLEIAGNRVASVRTSLGPIVAGAVALAAGPWAASLLRYHSWPLPTVPIVLRQARTASADVPRNHPTVRFPEAGAYVRPERGGYLFGAFQANARAAGAAGLPASAETDDLTIDRQTIDEVRKGLSPRLPPLDVLPIEHYRQGWTTFSPDGLPLAGRHPELTNLWLATGCGAMGYVWAPSIGRWLAPTILGAPATPWLARLEPARFGSLADDVDWVRGECRRRHADYYAMVGAASERPQPGAEHAQWT